MRDTGTQNMKPSEALNSVNARCITPVSAVVHTVTKDITVFDFQTNKIYRHTRCFAVMLLINQDRRQDLSGALRFAGFNNGFKGVALIKNVIDDIKVSSMTFFSNI